MQHGWDRYVVKLSFRGIYATGTDQACRMFTNVTIKPE
ncbi:hypothetical protein GDI1472 [Gluconacetobacter diazotrophicus PA1 5]|uniref:Uncharacterized protein n=1 Tax=Gluconacetobacter diazotrophicus (strain ATCC 49037 / DSM 5601 / CCUG 37298 / CIP 103539 / LMG 7603 / PAl5) TaxID=272568 RepID=A9HFV8_GLUDA|nr:hypothetical protein GDI1472 [Gluconacetobacter diazotrophicus PA1 5]